MEMKVGKQSQKSSNGPDWMDIRTSMKEMEILHKCACYIEVMPATTRYGPQMRFIVSAVSNAPGTDLKPCEESVAVNWPNNSNGNVESAVFAGLYRLDHRLTEKWWKQGELFLP